MSINIVAIGAQDGGINDFLEDIHDDKFGWFVASWCFNRADSIFMRRREFCSLSRSMSQTGTGACFV